MLRWRSMVVLGLVAIGASLGATGCTGDKAQPEASPSPAVSEGASAWKAPDGGEVRVVESGFSVFPDGSDQVMFGVVLESTSQTYTAGGVYVTATFLDSTGKEVQLSPSMPRLTASWVSVVPGKRVGTGKTMPYRRDEVPVIPAQVKVEITMPYWNSASRVRGIEITKVATVPSSTGPAAISFAVDSPFTETMGDPHVAVIIRDSASKIIGGAAPGVFVRPWPPGASVQTVHVKLPSSADPSRTEVYAGLTQVAR